MYGVSTPFSQLQLDVENEALMENTTQSDAELHLALSETPLERIDTQPDSEEDERDTDVHPELRDSDGVKETNVQELQDHTQQDSEEEEAAARDTDVRAEPQNDTQQDSDRRKKNTDVSREQRSPERSLYAGMTVSRLVQEDDSQASEDETQINIISPDRPPPQTRSYRYDDERC